MQSWLVCGPVGQFGCQDSPVQEERFLQSANGFRNWARLSGGAGKLGGGVCLEIGVDLTRVVC